MQHHYRTATLEPSPVAAGVSFMFSTRGKGTPRMDTTVIRLSNEMRSRQSTRYRARRQSHGTITGRLFHDVHSTEDSTEDTVPITVASPDKPEEPNKPDTPQNRPGWLRRGAKWLVGTILSLIAAATLALAVALTLVPILIGGHALTIVSGSMTPCLSVGAVVVNKPAEPDSLHPGDIITYVKEGDLVTHRIVEKTHGERGPIFTTKGDANDTVDDPPVQAEQVHGKLWYDVPHIGTARNFVASQAGLTIIGSAAALITTVWFLIHLNRPNKTSGKDS